MHGSGCLGGGIIQSGITVLWIVAVDAGFRLVREAWGTRRGGKLDVDRHPGLSAREPLYSRLDWRLGYD